MIWRLIDNSSFKQPSTGTYSDWKEQVAQKCHHQCVYCAIHETQFGGIVNYHIEHFKPKSIFPDLENDCSNLFYSCPICNRFKSNDWPNEPENNLPSYFNPSTVDYNTIYISEKSFQISGIHIASKYMIERLYLNRAQLIYERREYKKEKELKLLLDEINQLIENNNFESTFALKIFKELDTIKNNLLGLVISRKQIRPYIQQEIKR